MKAERNPTPRPQRDAIPQVKAPKRVSHREQAHDFAAQGVADLARAFNHCNNDAIPYRYTEAVQRRFLELCCEIRDLVEHGQLVARPLASARTDETFQRHLARITTMKPEP